MTVGRFALLVALVLASAVPAAAAREDVATSPIIGGSASSPGDWPWQVALLAPGATDTFEAAFCGGSLVHPEWVLTAAHCVYDPALEPGEFEVLAGTPSLREGGLRVAVEEIVIHPAYDGWFGPDAALLRLSKPLGIQIVPLLMDAASPLIAPGSTGTATGWGGTIAYPPGEDPSQDYPFDLRQVSLSLVPDTLCQQAYGEAYEALISLCAGDFEHGGVDTCQGDSGGPFVVRADPDAPWLLAGITSFGDGCGSPGYPGVYTDVSRILSFILEYVDVTPPGLSPRAAIPALSHN